MKTWVAVTALIALLLTGLAAAEIPMGRAAPELAAGAWINSEPLTLQQLRGRVVLIDFWTYG
jgi:hypothetical protein